MGSPGHKFIAHTKALSPRAQNNGGEYGLPPHPLAVRPGQRFWPRTGKRKLPFVVRKVTGERVTGKREEGDDAVTVSVPRLLVVAREGDQGRWYQFQGFVSRRYRTTAVVWEVDDRAAILCVPEWHPRRPVRYFRSLLPADAEEAGTWLSLTCDLSAPSAARLQVADLRVIAPPPEGSVHLPAVLAADAR